jgi:hypothetical protein
MPPRQRTWTVEQARARMDRGSRYSLLNMTDWHSSARIAADPAFVPSRVVDCTRKPGGPGTLSNHPHALNRVEILTPVPQAGS